jgi:enoyl-CoA hydratase/carnithine racemase
MFIIIMDTGGVEMSDHVLRESRDGVLRQTLNRPEQLNALNTDLVRALGDAVADARDDPTTRVVLITGSGRAFCAGADLVEAETIVQDAAAFRSWLLVWRDAFRSLEQLDKPVIAAVNGTALAGGLELALSCDVIVAARSARIGDAHANFGLVPGGGGSQRLPDAVGTRWARWLMYSGEVLAAERALAIGLVQAVYDDATFEADVQALAATMATRSARGLAFMKRLSSSPRVTDNGLDYELEAAAHVVVGPDAREGFAAFRDKRTPRFTAGPR